MSDNTQVADQIVADAPAGTEPSPKEGYSSERDGLLEAAAEWRQRRREAQEAAVTSQEHAEAKAELSQRVAERMNAPSVDLDTITVQNADTLSARQAGKLLSDYHAARDRELGEIIGANRRWEADRIVAVGTPEPTEERKAQQAEQQRNDAAQGTGSSETSRTCWSATFRRIAVAA